MGYDLRWVEPSEDAQAAYDKARRAHTEAQAALSALPDEEAGVLVDARLQDVLEGRMVPWDNGLFEGRTERYAAANDAAEAAREAREKACVWYRHLSNTQMGAVTRLMASLGMVGPAGIAPGQFVFNAGITWPSSECANAVARWRQIEAAGGDNPVDIIERALGKGGGAWWLSWIAYLEGAATHGGLVVR